MRSGPSLRIGIQGDGSSLHEPGRRIGFRPEMGTLRLGGMRRRPSSTTPVRNQRRTAPAVAAAALLALLLAGCTPPDTRAADGKPDGAKIYQVYCTGCHGPDGRRGEPRSHVADDAQTPQADLRAVIERGGDGMPAWKSKLSPAEIDAVIGYIRTLGDKPASGS